MLASFRRRRAAGAGVLLASLTVTVPLAGCAVALVAPLVAGAVIGEKNVHPAAALPPPASLAPAQTATLPAAPRPLLQPTSAPALPGSLAEAALLQPFIAYALERASRFGGADPIESALLVDDFSLSAPDRRPCTTATPAVLIDLDPGQGVFAPVPGAQPAPGLAENLARLREAGVVVLWISRADANRVTEIGDLLVAAGLDPSGRDPLLLTHNPEERKQTMRVAANVSVCLVAILGDQRGDFDELFDYVRDTANVAGLDAMLGAGWFLAPAPFIATAAAPSAVE